MSSLCLVVVFIVVRYSSGIVHERDWAYDEYSTFHEGDILADETKLALAHNHRLWPGGRMPYKVAFSYDDHIFAYNTLFYAITRLNNENCVKLEEMEPEDEDYVSIEIGPKLSSHLGRQGGKQVLTIPDKINWGSIMHELMHALGFGHEHNRPDRDEYVTVSFSNTKDDAKDYFESYDEDDVGEVDETPYDYNSLMHATGTNKKELNIQMFKPVIKRLDGNEELGSRRALSDGDKIRLRLAYSCDVCRPKESDGKLFRYPGDCKMYYKCSHGKAQKEHCEGEDIFDVEGEKCDDVDEDSCMFKGMV